MISITKVEKDYSEQCTSCHKTNDEADIYILHFGYNKNQTVGVKLCNACKNILIEKLNNLPSE